MYILKNMIGDTKSRYVAGHRMCAGCAVPVIVRTVLRAVKPEDHVAISNATGCLEVSSTIFPYTSWKDSYIHTAFASSAAAISGAESAYKALRKKGKISKDYDTKFLVFSGDGGTYDIGLQSLSGALERGHDFTYICYDNGGYMNTGIQRSSATPIFAKTTTTPIGSKIEGKITKRKDLSGIIERHHLPYMAQTALTGNFKDLYEKSQKAIYTEGPTFVNVFSPCPLGWEYPTEELFNISKLAVETCYWPLYEVINGKYILNYKPMNRKPIEEFLKTQKRFKHLFEEENKWMIEEIQKEVDENFNKLLKLEEMTKDY